MAALPPITVPLDVRPTVATGTPEPTNATKPGYLTTEFWVTVIVNLMFLVGVVHPSFQHTLDKSQVQSAALIASSISTFGYAIARAHVKANHLAASAQRVIAELNALNSPPLMLASRIDEGVRNLAPGHPASPAPSPPLAVVPDPPPSAPPGEPPLGH